MKRGTPCPRPSLAEIETEIARRKQKRTFFAMIRSIFSVLLVTAAAALLISYFWIPILQITGTSMEPKLNNGEIVFCMRNQELIAHGDIIAFYYNDKILLKRVIGLAGDVISISAEGVVSVNEQPLDEPYISTLSLAPCDLTFPVTVPENAYFVLGDHRTVSIDSRSKDMGMIYSERVVGKIVLRIFPLEEFGTVS